MWGSSRSRVHSVTGAPRSLRADVRSREVRYLISMGIRTICFVLAFVTGGYLRWALVVAAFVLPYFAVVIANAGRERPPTGMVPYTANRPALSGRGAPEGTRDDQHSQPDQPDQPEGSDRSGQAGEDRTDRRDEAPGAADRGADHGADRGAADLDGDRRRQRWVP